MRPTLALLWGVTVQAKFAGRAHWFLAHKKFHQLNHLDLIGSSTISMTEALQLSSKSLLGIPGGVLRESLTETQRPPTSCALSRLPRKPHWGPHVCTTTAQAASCGHRAMWGRNHVVLGDHLCVPRSLQPDYAPGGAEAMVTLSPQGPTGGTAGTLHFPEPCVETAPPPAAVPSLPLG